jgi:putative exosortase-associated protein (TIGR04073 family)
MGVNGVLLIFAIEGPQACGSRITLADSPVAWGVSPKIDFFGCHTHKSRQYASITLDFFVNLPREVSMKNMLKPLLLASALVFFSSQATASSYPEQIGNKLAHGVANTVTGIVEVPKNMYIESNRKGPAYGIPVGLFTGIVQGIGRTLTGVVDLVTFPIPTKPIIYPDFIWKDFDKETHYHPDWKLQQ